MKKQDVSCINWLLLAKENVHRINNINEEEKLDTQGCT